MTAQELHGLLQDLLSALAPIAAAAEGYEGDDEEAGIGDDHEITVGDLRAAQAVFERLAKYLDE